jgi:hypothetical protein
MLLMAARSNVLADCDLNCLSNANTVFVDCEMKREDEFYQCMEEFSLKTCNQERTQGEAQCNSTYDQQRSACGCTTLCSGYPDVICSSASGTGYDTALCLDGVWQCPSGATTCRLDQQPGQDCVCLSTGWFCTIESPILVDSRGEGFHLTDADHGVRFTFLPNSPAVQTSWTDAEFSNGWLALDRNGNGIIDDATELFGNLTPQPKSDEPNGYRALAVFDDPSNGGNGNGAIDWHDSVFNHLRLWIDSNHNGISEPAELHSLQEAGIFRISLRYTDSEYTDSFGNQFRYKAKIWDEAGRDSKLCYDVFLVLKGDSN